MFIYVCIYVYMYIHEIYMNLLYNVIYIKYICLLIHMYIYIYVHTSIDITGMCTASNIQQVWAAASTSRHTLFAVVPVAIRQ